MSPVDEVEGRCRRPGIFCPNDKVSLADELSPPLNALHNTQEDMSSNVCECGADNFTGSIVFSPNTRRETTSDLNISSPAMLPSVELTSGKTTGKTNRLLSGIRSVAKHVLSPFKRTKVRDSDETTSVCSLCWETIGKVGVSDNGESLIDDTGLLAHHNVRFRKVESQKSNEVDGLLKLENGVVSHGSAILPSADSLESSNHFEATMTPIRMRTENVVETSKHHEDEDVTAFSASLNESKCSGDVYECQKQALSRLYTITKGVEEPVVSMAHRSTLDMVGIKILGQVTLDHTKTSIHHNGCLCEAQPRSHTRLDGCHEWLDDASKDQLDVFPTDSRKTLIPVGACEMTSTEPIVRMRTRDAIVENFEPKKVDDLSPYDASFNPSKRSGGVFEWQNETLALFSSISPEKSFGRLNDINNNKMMMSLRAGQAESFNYTLDKSSDELPSAMPNIQNLDTIRAEKLSSIVPEVKTEAEIDYGVVRWRSNAFRHRKISSTCEDFVGSSNDHANQEILPHFPSFDWTLPQTPEQLTPTHSFSAALEEIASPLSTPISENAYQDQYYYDRYKVVTKKVGRFVVQTWIDQERENLKELYDKITSSVLNSTVMKHLIFSKNRAQQEALLSATHNTSRSGRFVTGCKKQGQRSVKFAKACGTRVMHTLITIKDWMASRSTTDAEEEPPAANPPDKALINSMIMCGRHAQLVKVQKMAYLKDEEQPPKPPLPVSPLVTVSYPSSEIPPWVDLNPETSARQVSNSFHKDNFSDCAPSTASEHGRSDENLDQDQSAESPTTSVNGINGMIID